jgi:general secretion pathway protein L
VHLALQPGARAGGAAWVAATHRRWLGDRLAALDAAGVVVDRVVPDAVPGVPARGHFVTGAEVGQGSTEDLWISWSDANGALCVRAGGGLARALLPGWLAQEPTWTAAPAAAAPAERWLGEPVQVQSEAEHALAAARSGWNLRQFDLALHPRGWRALRDFGRHALGPAWRPVRWGVAALVLVHLVGLNAWAWQQQRQLDARRAAMTELLRKSHPQVRAVLDAPAQMQRETEVLRAAAGRAGDADFETLLSIAAAAWPEGGPPVEQLRFETGRLMLPAAGWAPEQVQAFRARVEQSGGELSTADGQLVISRVRKGLP